MKRTEFLASVGVFTNSKRVNFPQVAKRATRGVVLAAVAGALVSCASSSGTIAPSSSEGLAETALAETTSPTDNWSSPEASTPGTVTPSTVASLESDTQASTRILRAPSANQVGVELVDGEGFNKIIVRRSGQTTPFKYEVSRLESPARLVVDVMGVSNSAPQTFTTADSELVQRVRLGAHPEKSRIVLDLIDGEQIDYNVDGIRAEGEELVVTVARPERMQVARAWEFNAAPATSDTSADQLSQNTTSAEADMRASFGEEETPATSDTTESATVASTDEATSGEELQAPTQLAEANDRPRIVSLSLDPVGPSENMVVAQVTGNSVYQLKKTAPSEYVLSVEGAEVDASAMNTLVALPGTGQIRTVRPVVAGENVLLRIFADPMANLTARASENKIVVVAGALGTDARAQADPSKTEGEAAAANKEGESTEVKLGAESAPSDIDAGIAALLGDKPTYTGRLISLDLQDTDIDNALRIIAEVSNLNIIASDDVTGKVTLRLIDVPWDQALDVILKTNGLDKVQEGNVVRIAPVEKLRLEREALKQAQQAEEELEPLQVRYIRISYAKAAELRTLVESVMSERGSVAYDERTNQLIVKDIKKGVRNVVELVSKLDLRTPQILLETQIVEANRNLLRTLGTELGFKFIQSPETGNATGSNFPNTVAVGGASSFPANVDESLGGSAIGILLDSADATRSLSLRINALEQEGRVRIVSRPAVATTNNTPAVIKSVEKIRVKTPSGGTVVGVGQGSTPSSGGSTATESIEIGIILEVTPQASPDYFVLLDLNAKSSTFGSRTVDNIPSEVERSATSSVLVSSGQTFAMGGIYRIIDRDTVTGVPFLKDIPMLGHLFRTMNSDNSDEELIFFVTPRIIEGSFDDAAMKVSL